MYLGQIFLVFMCRNCCYSADEVRVSVAAVNLLKQAQFSYPMAQSIFVDLYWIDMKGL